MVAPLQSAFHGLTAQATTCAVAYTTALSSGNKLVAIVGADSGSNVGTMTVKDAAGNSFTQVGVANAGSSGQAHCSVWAMDTPAGDVGATPTITASISTGADISLLIQEVPGLLAGNTTAMLDGTPGTSTGTGAGNSTSPTYFSTASGEYLIAAFSDNAFTDTITDPTSPWTSDPNNPAVNGVVHAHLCYKSSTGAGETGAVFGKTNTSSYAEVMVAFKLSGTAPSGLIPQQLKQRVSYQVLGSRPINRKQASYRG